MAKTKSKLRRPKGGNSGGKAADANNEAQTQREVKNIKPIALRNEVRAQKKQFPDLNLQQIVHDIILQGDRCPQLARDFLQRRNVTIRKTGLHTGQHTPNNIADTKARGKKPIAAANGTSVTDQRDQTASVEDLLKTLNGKNKQQYAEIITSYLSSTRATRRPIQLSELEAQHPQDNDPLRVRVNEWMAKSSQRSCEDALIYIANKGPECRTLARKFLLRAICKANDSQHESATPHDTSMEASPQEHHDADDELDDTGKDSVDVTDHEQGEILSSRVSELSDDPSVGRTNTIRRTARPGIAAPKPSMPELQLWQLESEKRRIQYLYFGIEDPSSIVTCITCGAKGHDANACQAGYCQTCAMKHITASCPHKQKCSRCRKRGHSTVGCSMQSVTAGQLGDECDICGRLGHAEEECGRLWCTFDPKDNVLTIPRSQMRSFCYNCGAQGHWGDNCSFLPQWVWRRKTIVSTFSAENAARFMDQDDKEMTQPQEGGSLPAHQIRQLGDYY